MEFSLCHCPRKKASDYQARDRVAFIFFLPGDDSQRGTYHTEGMSNSVRLLCVYIIHCCGLIFLIHNPRSLQWGQNLSSLLTVKGYARLPVQAAGQRVDADAVVVVTPRCVHGGRDGSQGLSG